MTRLVLCLILCVAFIAPAMAEETIRLIVWGAQGDQDILAAQIDEFKKAHPDKQYDISLAAVEEPELWERYEQDPEGMADLFAFASDQLIDLVNAEAILPVGRSRDKVIAENTPTSVDSATMNGTLYAYPMTEDNGYFLYYDHSVLTTGDVKTLDALLAKADAMGKKVLMDIANGWYVSSFFFGVGCTLDIDEEGRQICGFNSEAGVAAGEAIRAFTAHPAFLNGGDAALISGIGDTICAGVSGTWNAEAIRRKLGVNFSACKLPTFTLDGQQVQMGSFIGTKLMGVSVLTEYPEEADELAAFLNGEQAQIIRYKVRAIGPSNIEAANFLEIQNNIALNALKEQNRYGVSPKMVLYTFWEPAEAFGQAMADQSEGDMLVLLNDLVAAVEGN